MAASPLMDRKQFTRDMEAAYRRMWQTWCDQAGG
jgi:predicted O-linked N-acetylglucosamine transferase (SPINDLY family)